MITIKGKQKSNVLNIILFIFLSAGAICMLMPLLWMISTSLKEQWQVFSDTNRWIPNPIKFDNYVKIFTSLPFSFVSWIRNTFIITFCTIIGTLISSSIVAYGFARFRAPGKDFLFVLLLSTMMLPFAVTIIPVYVMFTKLGWVNSFLPLIIPSFFGNAFFIFLLRQFFITIPLELEEAARIDGMSTLRILASIIMPLTIPALITVAIMQFNGAWNDFFGPLIYINKPELMTLSLGINMFKSQYQVQWNYLMGASLISLAPSLILFFCCQKYFIEGITLTGMKA